ncbi:recombinase family protein [Trebonia kvetii]|uniref:recombinase family protein n=1 Tax=Trebonia kvetii TaxID=2480626 RepID=UPI001C9E327F|nr:recombinase family protein [Trebonia kvetii]
MSETKVRQPGKRTSARTRAGGQAVVGYARADGDGAALTTLTRQLREAGCALVATDERPGRQDDLPALRDCLAALRPGDVLVVASLDQLGRTRPELIGAVERVRRSGAGLRSLGEDLDTTGPGGSAIFRVFESLADFGRAAISAGTTDGLAAARARGTRLGRPPALTPDQLREVRELLLRPENTVAGIARELGVSRSTLYKYLPDAMHAGAQGQPTVFGEELGSHGRPPAAAHVAPYQARPGRRAIVIDNLADLCGPTKGSVKLPLRLFWSLPDHHFDLDDPDIRRWYYQTVLREASRAEDLTTYLDAGTLTGLWPELFLPRGVRRAWEEYHPALRAVVSA